MDSTLIAHVADSIERISGGEVENYDATADFAAEMLHADAALRAAAGQYGAGAMDSAEFDAVVARAAERAGE
jgi:hypothetical protein